MIHSTIPLPERLCLNDRNGVPKAIHNSDAFQKGEKLYRSFVVEMRTEKNKKSVKFPACALRFPSCSFNWSRYSESDDRWLYSPKQAILALELGEVFFKGWPAEIPIIWKVHHRPEASTSSQPENYSHAEVMSWILGQIEQVEGDPESGMEIEQRTAYRYLISRAAQVVHPEGQPSGWIPTL